MEINTTIKRGRAVKWIRACFFISLLGFALFSIGIGSILIYAKVLGTPPLAVPQSTLYFADDGTVIGENHSGEKRYWVDLDNISPFLVNGTLAIEDKNFFEHNGFDYKRIAGAALADLKAMAKVQGASTISQQYARNLFLSHDKTWKRKLSEALYTIRLEMNYSKEEILEGYLNTIYYGHGAYGIQAASQYYFGKNASDLTLAEASMLAGIPKGPGIYSPIASLEKAKMRQKLILNEMKDSGFITEEQVRQAQAQELRIVGEHVHNGSELAPYFRDTVNHILKTELGLDDRTIDLGGLRVYTTLNTEHQKIAERIVEETIAPESSVQLGFVSMDPDTNFVTALIGGRDYAKSPFNRATQAVRQPGSTFKAFLYYAALEKGFTPATMLRSERTSFRFDEGRGNYVPSNYNNKYANKPITMAQALAVSDNVYAVKTHLFLGQDTLIETAQRFGISTPLKKVPSLALGTSGTRVIEMVNAYNIIAAGGVSSKPVFIKRVENADGEILYKYDGKKERVLDKKTTAVLTHMMTGMFDENLNGYASVTGATIAEKATRTYAGKSGSTNSDHWMIGFTPQLVSGIWTGYDDSSPITLTADKRYGKEIWINFMEEALDGQKEKTFNKPKGVKTFLVNPENGKLATKNCPVKQKMVFVKGTEPTEYCTDHLDHSQEKEEKPQEKEKNWFQRLFD